jgi:hypothetical protein
MTNNADWALYQKGIDYNQSISYNDTVNRNWRLYNLQHLDFLNTKGLPKVKVPMSQRITNQNIATCMTKAVKMNYIIENISDDTKDPDEIERKALSAMVSQNSKDRWEQLKMDDLIRSILLDGANSGDMCAHTYFDPSYDTGQTGGEEPILDEDGNPVLDEMGMPQTKPVPILGEFWTESVDGVNVYFGNPNDKRVNFNGRPHQPYIIIAGREVVSKLKKEAKLFKKENGLTDDEINQIAPDREYDEQAGDRGKKELEDCEYGKATYIIKYWEQDGKIMFNKSVRSCYIRKNVDSELTLYPIAWANWGIIKNSYHGQALMSGLVENQLELDKAWMALFKYLKDMAFPKAIANKLYFPDKKVSNKIGDVIFYEGNENVNADHVLKYTQPAQIANHIIDILTIFKQQTMELMGASDTMLGNVNPENTSAIVANVQNSTVPLENVKSYVHQFVEDIGYIWLDFMLHKYKVPRKIAVDNDGVRQMILFDPSKLSKAKFRIKVDVISGSYVDEFTAMRAIENLFIKNQIDVVQFVERLPEGAIPEKEKLLVELKAKIAQQQQMQTDEYKAQIIQEFLKGGANAGSPMPQMQ